MLTPSRPGSCTCQRRQPQRQLNAGRRRNGDRRPLLHTLGTLSNSNYTITYTGNSLAITPATMTVTAGNASRYVGSTNPAFTYTVSGLTNGDALADVISSLVLTTPATSISPSGSYAITPGCTPISSNYTVSFLDGVLTVSRAHWQDAAYTGAVGPAAQVGFTSPGQGKPACCPAIWFCRAQAI
jgi:hypothetical protein